MDQAVWREPFDIHNLKRHADSRGFLIELLRFKDDGIPAYGQLYTFSITPGSRRGDHFHLRKREWFACVHGEAIVLLSAAEGETCAYQLSPHDPAIIYAGLGTAHALINETNDVAVIVSYGSEQHDPHDEDTYAKTAFEGFHKEYICKKT